MGTKSIEAWDALEVISDSAMSVFEADGKDITRRNMKKRLFDTIDWDAYKHHWKSAATTKGVVYTIIAQLIKVRDEILAAGDEAEEDHWQMEKDKYHGLLVKYLESGDRPNVQSSTLR